MKLSSTLSNMKLRPVLSNMKLRPVLSNMKLIKYKIKTNKIVKKNINIIGVIVLCMFIIFLYIRYLIINN